MRNLRTTILILVLVLAYGLLLVPPTFASKLSKEEYYHYLPLEVPRVVRQTQASARLHLYGDPTDPSYRDIDPVDGIDDSRHAVLQRLAVQFAPYLVLNTTAIPMDFKRFGDDKQTFPLFVDTWNTATPSGELIREERIDMLSVIDEPCRSVEYLFGNSTKEDCRWLALLAALDPESPASAIDRTAAVSPFHDELQVVYLDFPGHDEKTWKQEYENTTGQLPSKYQGFLKTYVHPFLHEVDGSRDEGNYEFVLQYWFFYPWNDGGNNHVGDWEHLNVIISPLGKVTRNLTAEEIARMIMGEGLDTSTRDEMLVIKRIDYYFHTKVWTLDFSSPNAYLPRDEWQANMKTMQQERTSQDWVWKRIRFRTYWDDDETRINTHPIGYIGADNKGTDQVLALPGGKNRDSHGTFPFAALYKDVGPVSATENIGTRFDHRKFSRSSAADQAELLNRFKRGGVVSLAANRFVEIVPDYERIHDQLYTNPAVRANWSWLVLPIRWGYPAVESPFAGVVAHAETGNLAPVGPSYSKGWNRVGASSGFAEYDPHKFPRLVPLGWVDGFMNSWGFLNLTLPTLSIMPPFDVLWRVVAAPVRGVFGLDDPTFFPRENVPFRFFGLTAGAARMDIKEDFDELLINQEQFDEIVARLLVYFLVNGSENTVVVSSSDYAENPVAPYYQITFFIGKKFSSESMLRHSRSELRSELYFSDILDPFVLSSELNMWEYAGSFRYSLSTGSLQPFLKAGYGLSWYRLEKVATNGELLTDSNSYWVRKPSVFPFKNLLPNTLHLGAGFEWVMFKSYAPIPKGIDFSLRIEWIRYWHNLGLEVGDLPLETLVLLGLTAEGLPRDRTIHRDEVRLGLTLGF